MESKTQQDVQQEVLSNVESIEFQTFAEDAPVMLWLTNAEGKNIFSNAKWQNFIGRDLVRNLGGKAWYDALHPDDREFCLNIFKDAFDTHKSFEMEYRIRRRDGVYRYMLDLGQPYIEKKTGKFAGFIGSSTDISDQKFSEEEITKSHNELIQYNQEMRLVNQLNSYLQVCRTLKETYPVISHYMSKVFPDCSGALFLFNENRTLVESVTEWGNPVNKNSPVIAADDCWSLRQGKEHIVLDTDQKLCCKHIETNKGRSYTCVPIIAQGEMMGMLHIEFGNTEELETQEDLERYYESRQRLIMISADNLALSLVSLKLREALKNQSIRDPLTKLYNRRYMEESLEREMTRCMRSEQGMGIIMCDIDHFKTFNDEYGHDAGDLVLVEVAKFISDFFREYDIVCRYGGEEIIIIMPNSEQKSVEERANKICEGLRELEIIYAGKPLPKITASFGISHQPTNGEQANVLLKAADSALYDAKNGGRDQVVAAKVINNRRKITKTKLQKKAS